MCNADFEKNFAAGGRAVVDRVRFVVHASDRSRRKKGCRGKRWEADSKTLQEPLAGAYRGVCPFTDLCGADCTARPRLERHRVTTNLSLNGARRLFRTDLALRTAAPASAVIRGSACRGLVERLKVGSKSQPPAWPARPWASPIGCLSRSVGQGVFTLMLRNGTALWSEEIRTW